MKHIQRRTKFQSGLTLLEITIALGVIVIIGAVAAFSFRPDNSAAQHRALERASQTLVAHIRQTQRLAMAEGRSMSIDVERENDRYRLTCSTWVYLPGGVTFSAAPAVIGYTKRGTPSFSFTIWLHTSDYQQRITVPPAGGRVQSFPIEPIGSGI